MFLSSLQEAALKQPDTFTGWFFNIDDSSIGSTLIIVIKPYNKVSITKESMTSWNYIHVGRWVWPANFFFKVLSQQYNYMLSSSCWSYKQTVILLQRKILRNYVIIMFLITILEWQASHRQTFCLLMVYFQNADRDTKVFLSVESLRLLETWD